jgi:broad specificity phosphatase PhoE
MLIYLRHGDDRGDDDYRHDRRLNDRGKKQASKEAKQLIETYGHPDVVFVSPFRRAIETVDCMTVHFARPVEIHRDARIAQHLSGKQQRDPKVSPATLEVIVVDEDRDAFKKRVAEHVGRVRRRAKEGSAIWCVTHQVVIEEIAEHFDVKISGSLDFLDHVVMLR